MLMEVPTKLSMIFWVWGSFSISSRVSCCVFFFTLSPVHRLDKELGRLLFFSFFSRLCVGCYTHTACCVQLIKIFDSAFSVLPTRPSSSSSFWRRREEGKKEKNPFAITSFSRPKRYPTARTVCEYTQDPIAHRD